ncbi:FAD-binding and (Fe-S)-binding domain-containing protein [Actinomadura sp. WMMB 499]|uniref:FAD-binding and (Fe-S)-binding domain-containing protein n=1 Tax=Actinomadura sp. WMMB 499 TaxID=1219491 RepID=UPI0020C7F98B|nr:FAD-binding and (Fe-S)-binding domain-containing protein [Actinomadura sp. WMMB 499]
MTDHRDLVAALRRAGVSGVDDSALARAMYSSDASLYRVPPAVVVTPREAGELPAALAVCREFGVPLTMRGGGTSIAGNAVGPGVVADVSRHLNRVLEVDPEAGTALVEPGIVQARLHEIAGAHGLRFGPDPSTRTRATLGGMIGNNACGSRALGYGRTSDNVLGLDVVTGSGERLRIGDVPGGSDAAALDSPLLERLRALTGDRLALIRTEFGRFGRQVSAYSLEHLLPERRFDVARALVGSEGTLALTLAARLRMVREPEHRLLVVLGYGSMAEAADAVPAILPHGPVACEGLDSRITSVVAERRGPGAVPELPKGSGWLLVELAGPDAGVLHGTAARVVADSDCTGSMLVDDMALADALWRIREDGSGLVARTPDGEQAHAGWEDAAVPPERLGVYLREFEALLGGHGLAGVPYGHFGDGCVHVRIDFPFGRAGGTRVFRDFLQDAAALAARHGGTMSGEHGDGRARGELLPHMYSGDALALCADVKDLFDPDGVLNPGIIVRPAPVDADLRAARVPRATRRELPLGLAYRDDRGDLSRAVHRCTGIGKCRADNTGAGGVMCPSYVATREEKDSTRGARAGAAGGRVRKAAGRVALGSRARSAGPVPLLQGVRVRLPDRDRHGLLQGRGPVPAVPPQDPPARALRARVAASVDAPRRARPRDDPSGERRDGIPGAAAAGGVGRRDRPAPVAAGVRPDDVPPLVLLAHLPEGRHGDVVLFVDTFTDAFSPDVGKATVRVLEDAGYRVTVTERPVCCGITWISTGQLDGARAQARRTVRALLPHVRRGAKVVGMEPSCTGVLRSDAEELLDGVDAAAAREVAAATRTLAELLAETGGWTPPDLSGVSGVAQPHCHHHAVMGWRTDAALLRDAGADVRGVGGCCGLAGNFGVEKGHHDVSVAVAEHRLLPAVRAAADGEVVLADGFSCRTQLDFLAGRTGEHLAQLLARHLRD